MAYTKYHKSTIDCKKIRPHCKELVDRCGTIEKAAEYALVGKGTIARVMHEVHCTVQQATAHKILVALDHKREEDRKAHATHARLLAVRQRQIRREDMIERLAGY